MLQRKRLSRRWFVFCSAIPLIFVLATQLTTQCVALDGESTTEIRPNVIIIFIDDMGWGDVGFNGATGPKTPNLDQMAKDGMRFNDFYVGCSVCTGSRTALLTGCHYARLGMKPVLFPHDTKGLAQDEITIADMLKESGYATACVGKWHLGHLPPCLPTYQGFDSYYGIPYSNDMWIDPANKLADDIVLRNGLSIEEVKAGHKEKNEVPLMRNEEVIEYPCDQSTVTKRYTEQAIKFIETSSKANKPFFLYLPHTMVHLPLAASKDFAGRTDQLIWDCIEEIDWSVGEILACLKKNNIDDKTLVVFTSDNGAAVGSSLPLRGRKFTVYDGGVREPTLMHWTGTIPTGSVCDEICASVDLLPTIAALSNANLPKRKLDGHDISDLILAKDGAKSPHETYCVNHAGGMVRSGKWKFYPWKEKAKGRGSAETIGTQPSPFPVQLYDVRSDIGERTNLAEQHPEVVARLKSAFEAHVNELKTESREMMNMRRADGTPSAERPKRKPKQNKNRKSKQKDQNKKKSASVN